MTSNLSMLPSLFPLVQFIFFFFFMMGNDVVSQTLSDSTHIPSQGSSLTTNFQPSLAVVIGMLALIFSLTFLLLLYAKFCHRPASSSIQHHIRDGLERTPTTFRPTGVDKTVVESLPFFRFSSLKGSKQGLECSVCLAKFQDIEILRMLPKCKHGFHMDCIDEWLDKHPTCPLCRQKVTADDLSLLPCSTSFRYLRNQSEDSNLELYVEREEEDGCSRSVSLRKIFVQKEDELPIQERMDCDGVHKFNHKINNRWSNVTSSDLMFLNSEMLNDVSTDRFSQSDGYNSKALNPCSDNRSMSEIIIHPRFITSNNNSKDSSSTCTVQEERVRKLWLPIATKTAHWFANRETN